jgi:hypothetical protein
MQASLGERAARRSRAKLGWTGLEPRHECLGWNGLAEQEALHATASVGPEQQQLFQGLHALGDRREVEAPRELHDHLRDRRVGGVRGERAHERLVDLEHVDRKPLEIGERGVARPEVVDREPHTEVLQVAQRVHGHLDVPQQAALGDLQLQGYGRKPALLERVAHDLRQSGLEELM